MCKVEGCTVKIYAKGYCRRHYEQQRTLGSPKRTMRDPNTIVIYRDYADILLFNRKGERVGATKVSLDKVEKASKYKWRMDTSTGYVLTTLLDGHKTLSLHRYLMDAKEDDIVDHINHDILDNTNENMRICSKAENCRNRQTSLNNTSGVTGVYYHTRDRVWTACIGVAGKLMHLGNFNDKEEAIRVRRDAEVKYFGEFRANYIDEY